MYFVKCPETLLSPYMFIYLRFVFPVDYLMDVENKSQFHMRFMTLSKCRKLRKNAVESSKCVIMSVNLSMTYCAYLAPANFCSSESKKKYGFVKN